LPAEVFTLAKHAGWYTANTRAGFKDDLRSDVVQMVHAMRKLHEFPNAKWRGVNVGGCLLLERGPAYPFYENNGLKGELCEWAATEQLRRSNKLEALRLHRENHVTRETIQEIARKGFNAIRVPFGYWIITGPTHGDPYMGPDVEKVDNIVQWAREANLQVLLDLHGNPGGESEEKPCGRENKHWCFEHWRRGESLEVIRTIASRYAHESHVTGVQVCNEPSKKIDPKLLVRHYVKCVAAVREGGMCASRVSVVCPMYLLPSKANREAFLDEWFPLCADGKLDGAVIDFHPYFFGPWARESTHGNVREQARREAERIIGKVPSSMCGEWSAAFHGNTDERRMNHFLEAQQDTYAKHSTHGDFYWNWSDGCKGWSRKAGYLVVKP
jgi:hypothetical protein